MSLIKKILIIIIMFKFCFYNQKLLVIMDKEDRIICLNDFNFDQFLELEDNWMILFYYPSSKNSEKALIEFKKLHKLKDININLAKVDMLVNKNISYKTILTGLPTIKLFIKKKPILFDREITEKELINFAFKKTGRAVKELNTIEESEKFINENNVSIIYFGKNNNLIKFYTNVAEKIAEYQFALSKNNEIVNKYNAEKESLVIFKKFDDRRNDLKNIINEEMMEKFIFKNSISKIMPLNEKSVHLIFNMKKPGLILYADPQSEQYQYYRDLIYNVSKHFIIDDKEIINILFVITESINEYVERISEYIEVDFNNEIPSVKIIDLSDVYRKYNMVDEINEENIIKFINNWKEKKIKPILSSEIEPENNDDSVYKLVGTTFEREVFYKNNDVLVNFYATWEDNFKDFKLGFYDLAEKVKNNTKLIIAEMDGTKNEVENVRLDGFPTVKLYPAGKKNNPIDYEGKPNVEELLYFLKKYATYPIIIPENK